jgi:hypothetical protein
MISLLIFLIMKSDSFGIFLNLNLSLPTSEWTENREWGSGKDEIG